MGGEKVYLSSRKSCALIRSQCVWDRHFDVDKLAFISDQHAKELTNVEVRPDDLLLNITGDGITFARCCIVPSCILPARVNQHVAIVRLNKELAVAGYVLSYLTLPTIKNYIESFNAGGSRRAITKGHIENFAVPLPPLQEQQAIASVLGALDDKIELNRRMNETLEAMARAIFRDWFVDFGPTRAKQEGREPYLAPEIWSLFPDRLDDEGKPEGWRRQTLGHLEKAYGGEIRTGPFGSQLHQSDYVPSGTPVVMPANLTLGEIIEDGIARIDADTLARLSDHRLRIGDIIYGRRGDIGRKALVGPDEEGWLCGTGCLRVRISSNQCPPLLLFYHLDQPEVREWIATRAIGATMPNLNTSILREVELFLPGKELCAEFTNICSVLVDRSRASRSESKTLIALRDLLLPKLMSGQIRIRDAEKIVEDAA